jgi:hypothetical protein
MVCRQIWFNIFFKNKKYRFLKTDYPVADVILHHLKVFWSNDA